MGISHPTTPAGCHGAKTGSKVKVAGLLARGDQLRTILGFTSWLASPVAAINCKDPGQCPTTPSRFPWKGEDIPPPCCSNDLMEATVSAAIPMTSKTPSPGYHHSLFRNDCFAVDGNEAYIIFLEL
jgi:hypothetical protein